jgi:DNA-binding NtrC family response regulator
MTDTRQRVFVVDDEPVIAITLASILCLKGYNARSFVDPRQALEAFHDECPDLLISDVMMPELTGVDLAIQVKAICPGCRVLLISGQAATDDLLGPAREHGHDFQLLAKPVTPPRLLEIVQQSFQPTA